MKSENNRHDVFHSGLVTIIRCTNQHSGGFNHIGLVSDMEPKCDPAIGHISTELTGRIQNNSLSTISPPTEHLQAKSD